MNNFNYFFYVGKFRFWFRCPNTSLAAYVAILLNREVTSEDHEFSYNPLDRPLEVSAFEPDINIYLVVNQVRISRALGSVLLSVGNIPSVRSQASLIENNVQRIEFLKQASYDYLSGSDKFKLRQNSPYPRIKLLLKYLDKYD